MLFILNLKGVPSVGKIIQVSRPLPLRPGYARPRKPEAAAVGASAARDRRQEPLCPRATVRAAAGGTRVVAGSRESARTASRPLGRRANEAPRSLEGVQYVDRIPDGDSSTATVYLEDDGPPAWIIGMINSGGMVHETYELRG